MGEAALTSSRQRAWTQLAGAASEPLRRQLLAAWSEPQRHYHTLQHLGECLAHFDAAQALAPHPGEVCLALWFHDAVYAPTRHDNEQRSADWARESVLQAGGATAAADRVHALVMATRHDAAPSDADAQLLVDIDLAILGAPRERFDEYEQQVGLEYAHVPAADRRVGRSRVLRGFLERPAIYSTPFFRARLEAAARENLAYSLAKLGC